MRQLELADAALAVGAGVGAGRRAEELDLQQGVRNGGDVNGDQRLVGAAGGAVDRMRQQLLPVPVSPSSSTGASSGAARRARRLTSRLAGLLPTKLEKLYLARRACACASDWRVAISSACRRE